MNKENFLSALEKALTDLPQQDRTKVLDFYRELIDDRLEEGLTEAVILADIGSPEAIADQILSELPSDSPRKFSWGILVLLVLGSPVWLSLLIGAAAVILSGLTALFSVELTLAAVGLSGTLASVFLLILGKPIAFLALLGCGLFSLGLAIPFYFLCKLTAKAVWQLTRSTFRSVFRKGVIA